IADQEQLRVAGVDVERHRHPARDAVGRGERLAVARRDLERVQALGNRVEVVGPAFHHQMTILAIVMNSCSEIGRSLQRRCAIAAAPMLPASTTSDDGRVWHAARLLSAKYASPQPMVSTTLVLSVGSAN